LIEADAMVSLLEGLSSPMPDIVAKQRGAREGNKLAHLIAVRCCDPAVVNKSMCAQAARGIATCVRAGSVPRLADW
jgi:hypothetical protein